MMDRVKGERSVWRGVFKDVEGQTLAACTLKDRTLNCRKGG